jgi:putative transferase (TIGR04331 family)
LRILIFNGIPKNYNPQKHILFSIANFQDHEEKYSTFKDQIAINYTKSVSENIKTGLLTSEYALSLISEYSVQFNKLYKSNYSEAYWKILLYPWIVSSIQLLYERQLMVRTFISQYRNEELLVNLLEDHLEINISDTSELVGEIQQNPIFNHWIFSRIIEENIPEKWKVNYVPVPLSNVIKSSTESKLPEKLLGRAYKRVVELIAGNVSNVYGLNVVERIFFSFLVQVKPPIRAAMTNRVSCNLQAESIKWEFEYRSLLDLLMPSNLLNLDHKTKRFGMKGKLHLYSNDLYYNVRSKLKAAAHQAQDGLICPSQHGGYKYGIGYINEVIKNIEIYHDFFIAWGSSIKQGSKVISLPSPMLSKLLNKHKKTVNRIILVSSSSNYYGARYNSWLPPYYIYEYRDEREEFLRTLSDKILSTVSYKPYPERRDSLRDVSYFKKKFENLTIINSHLDSHLLTSRLVVLDHPGTTLAKTLVANAPTVIYFKREHFDQIGDVKKIFNEFAEVGIYHESAKSAAQYINKNVSDIDEWWNSDEVQCVRKKFMFRYAQADRHWFYIWCKTIWRLK